MYTRRRRKKPNRKMRKIKFIFFTFYPLMYVHRCESFLTFTLHAGFSFLEFIFILYHANTEGKEMCMQNAACSLKLFPTNFHFSALKYRCLVCDTPRRRCKNFFSRRFGNVKSFSISIKNKSANRAINLKAFFYLKLSVAKRFRRGWMKRTLGHDALIGSKAGAPSVIL